MKNLRKIMNTPIYADLDQIVFEGREQNYGAYHMRKRYNRILTRASLIAFLLFISITALPKVMDWIMPKLAEPVVTEETFVYGPEIPLPPKDLVEPVELPAQPAAPILKTLDMSVPTPTPAEQLIDEQIVAEITDADSAAIGTDTHDGDATNGYDWTTLNNNPCPTCPPTDIETVVLVNPEDKDPSIDTFVLLEKEPKPVNLDELKGLIGYPKMAVEAGIEGKVIVRVLIDKHGNYKSHKVLKDAHPILNSAVNDKIHLLKMTPGIQAGKPISVWVTLPFNFELMN
jgi:periplasmic protein TonB